MKEEQKRIAYKAIDDNVEASTARQIIRYVMECELWKQDTISPSIEYLAKKYTWSKDTTKVAISKAKKSQFITTTGYGKNRCFELNVGHLKAKMAEAYQKTLRPVADFSDVLPEGKTNTLANTLANSSANTLANSFTGENGSTEPQNHQNEGDNSNNNNYNLPAELRSDIVIVRDEEEKPSKPDKRVKEKLAIYRLFGDDEKVWWRSKPQRDAALRLHAFGYEQAKRAVSLCRKYRDDIYCPKVNTPVQLLDKWESILDYKERNKIR